MNEKPEASGTFSQWVRQLHGTAKLNSSPAHVHYMDSANHLHFLPSCCSVQLRIQLLFPEGPPYLRGFIGIPEERKCLLWDQSVIKSILRVTFQQDQELRVTGAFFYCLLPTVDITFS